MLSLIYALFGGIFYACHVKFHIYKAVSLYREHTWKSDLIGYIIVVDVLLSDTYDLVSLLSTSG